MHLNNKLILMPLLLFFLLFFSITKVSAATYYSSPAGSGTTCSFASPCTLNTGLGKLTAGSTLYLRGGSYNQMVSINASGNSGSYITVAGYPGETAIIDGVGTIASGNDLVKLNGAYVELKDITIQNSAGNNISLYGNYDKLTNAFVTRSWVNAIRQVGDHQTIEGCRVYYNSLISEFGASTGYGSAIGGEKSTNLMIKNNIVWNNWGEGINPYEANYATVQDNISYDNLKMNLNVSTCRYCLFQRNLLYVTPGNVCQGYPNGEQGGILYLDEPDQGPPDSQYNIITNNISVGGIFGFWFLYYKTGTGLVDTIIANNTFIINNSSGRSPIQIDSGAINSNSVFKNNIVVQQGSSPITYIPSTHPGITFSNNIWSKTPGNGILGTGDIIGDPLLVDPTHNLLPGQVLADWYKLKSNSPAINKAVTLPEVTDDYFRTLRSQYLPPDIGAHEYVSGATPTPTPCPLKSLGDTNCSGTIDITDLNYLISHYGSNDTGADLDSSGKVNLLDLSILIRNFGRTG